MKKRPYLPRPEVHESFAWRRHELLLEVGADYFVNPGHALEVDRIPVVGTQADEDGLQAVSLDIRTAEGVPIFRMEANHWTLTAEVEDFECPPSAYRLALQCPAHNVELAIRFREVDEGELTTLLTEKMRGSPFLGEESPEALASDFTGSVRSAIWDWPVTLFTMTGRLAWPREVVLDPAANRAGVVFMGFNLLVGAGWRL
jgi:hypothetical protein